MINDKIPTDKKAFATNWFLKGLLDRQRSKQEAFCPISAFDTSMNILCQLQSTRYQDSCKPKITCSVGCRLTKMTKEMTLEFYFGLFLSLQKFDLWLFDDLKKKKLYLGFFKILSKFFKKNKGGNMTPLWLIDVSIERIHFKVVLTHTFIRKTGIKSYTVIVRRRKAKKKKRMLNGFFFLSVQFVISISWRKRILNIFSSFIL